MANRPSPSRTNRDYLLTEQYRNADNLNARIQLHERFSINPYGWHRWLFDQFSLPPGARILEVGCGPGTLWHENRDRIPPGWEIVLSDLSAGMINEARQNLRASGHGLRFEILDAQALPFVDASFDVVIACHMLYHVPDRARALAEIRRVLRPGSCLFASTLGGDSMRELRERVLSVVPEAAALDEQWGVPFSLENGAAQLKPWFSPITLHRYEDGLRVTEVEPLVAYVLSGRYRELLAGDRLAAFIDSVERDLAADGAILISKSAGVFEAAVKTDDLPR